MGKRRLAEDGCDWRRHQDVVVARSRASAAEGWLAYTSIVDWLRTVEIWTGLKGMDPIWLPNSPGYSPNCAVNDLICPLLNRGPRPGTVAGSLTPLGAPSSPPLNRSSSSWRPPMQGPFVKKRAYTKRHYSSAHRYGIALQIPADTLSAHSVIPSPHPAVRSGRFGSNLKHSQPPCGIMVMCRRSAYNNTAVGALW